MRYTNEIVTEIVTKGAEASRKAMNILAKGGERYTKTIGKLSDTTQEYTTLDVRRTAQGWKATKQIKTMTGDFRRFKMQLLSTMFFGMAIVRVFKSLLSPSLELIGAFDILNTTLGLFFLPTVLMLLDPLLKISNFFISASDSTKKFWGWVVILLGIMGGLVMVFSLVALGVIGFISACALVGVTVLGGIAIIAGLAAVIIGVILVITNWGKITDWLKERWTAFKDFIIGVWEGIKKAATVFWEAITHPFETIGKIFGKIGALIGFQYGGVVPTTGAYKLHAGETVSPAGAFMFSPTVYISATVSSDVDIRRLGEGLSRIWAEDLKSRLLR